MPDHLHLLATAWQPHLGVPRFMKQAKQASGYSFAQARGEPLWQDGYQDRVLRRDEDPARVIAYMVANPIRSGLTDDAAAYPFWGSEVFSRAEILDIIAIGARRT